MVHDLEKDPEETELPKESLDPADAPNEEKPVQESEAPLNADNPQ